MHTFIFNASLLPAGQLIGTAFDTSMAEANQVVETILAACRQANDWTAAQIAEPPGSRGMELLIEGGSISQDPDRSGWWSLTAKYLARALEPPQPVCGCSFQDCPRHGQQAA